MGTTLSQEYRTLHQIYSAENKPKGSLRLENSFFPNSKQSQFQGKIQRSLKNLIEPKTQTTTHSVRKTLFPNQKVNGVFFDQTKLFTPKKDDGTTGLKTRNFVEKYFFPKTLSIFIRLHA